MANIPLPTNNSDTEIVNWQTISSNRPRINDSPISLPGKSRKDPQNMSVSGINQINFKNPIQWIKLVKNEKPKAEIMSIWMIKNSEVEINTNSKEQAKYLWQPLSQIFFIRKPKPNLTQPWLE